jgi:hypothetical protein
MNIELLYEVAGRIKSGWEMMGSHWGNHQAEVIACQSIVACRNNHKECGDAFSWDTLITGSGNGEGLRLLLEDDCIVIEEYGGDLAPPSDTRTENGKPRIIRVTDKLLEYVDAKV